MKNREATLRKIDSLDSNLNRLVMSLNQGDREGCYETTQMLREQLEQIRTYIDSEPLSGYELNNIQQ